MRTCEAKCDVRCPLPQGLYAVSVGDVDMQNEVAAQVRPGSTLSLRSNT